MIGCDFFRNTEENSVAVAGGFLELGKFLFKRLVSVRLLFADDGENRLQRLLCVFTVLTDHQIQIIRAADRRCGNPAGVDVEGIRIFSEHIAVLQRLLVNVHLVQALHFPLSGGIKPGGGFAVRGFCV